jgi:hypothetical protein
MTYYRNMIVRTYFNSAQMISTVHLMEQIYHKIGSPKLSARVGWSVFVEMVNVYIELQTGGDEL